MCQQVRSIDNPIFLEVYLGQHGLIYTTGGAQLGAQTAESKAMEAGAAAAAAAQWQGYDMAAVQQQQQQQQLLNQYALNQRLVFKRGGPWEKNEIGNANAPR